MSDPRPSRKPATPRTAADDLRRIIAAAEKKGVTQYRLAKLAGMPPMMVARVASGETTPRLDTAQRIALAAGYRLTFTPLPKARRSG